MNWLEGNPTHLKICHSVPLQNKGRALEQSTKHRPRSPGICAAFANMPLVKQIERGATLISCCLKGVFILLSASHRSFGICITDVHFQVALTSIETFLEPGQSHVGISSCTAIKDQCVGSMQQL